MDLVNNAYEKARNLKQEDVLAEKLRKKGLNLKELNLSQQLIELIKG